MTDIERSLVGMCLNRMDDCEEVIHLGVRSECFEDPVCAEIFACILTAEMDGKRAGTGMASLSAASKAAIPFLRAECPIAQNVAYYAKEVLTASWQRQALEAAYRLYSDIKARQPHDPIDRLQATARGIADLIARGGESGDIGSKNIADVMPEWVDDVERRMGDREKRGIPTGFRSLDILFNGGWNRRGMYTVAARPGRGKTTFGVTTAIGSAAAGARVLFATVEMTTLDILTKLVSNQAQVRGGKFLTCDLTAAELDRTARSRVTLEKLPLAFNDAWQGDFQKLATNCHRLKRRGGLDLVVIDYIGLIRLPGKWNSRRDEVAEISSKVKLLALELDAAVVILAQLNRNAENFDVPGIDHIADADNIGRDSDGVILIYRDSSDGTRFSIAKNRWGKETDFPITADLAHNAFRSVDLNWEALEG